MRGISLVKRTVVSITRSILRKFSILSLSEPSITNVLYSDLSERLNLSRDEGEKWIVNLIRESRMGADAKIDLEKASKFDVTPFTSVLILKHPAYLLTECHRDQPPTAPRLPICD